MPSSTALLRSRGRVVQSEPRAGLVVAPRSGCARHLPNGEPRSAHRARIAPPVDRINGSWGGVPTLRGQLSPRTRVRRAADYSGAPTGDRWLSKRTESVASTAGPWQSHGVRSWRGPSPVFGEGAPAVARAICLPARPVRAEAQRQGGRGASQLGSWAAYRAARRPTSRPRPIRTRIIARMIRPAAPATSCSS